jgi:hypothetical protein
MVSRFGFFLAERGGLNSPHLDSGVVSAVGFSSSAGRRFKLLIMSLLEIANPRPSYRGNFNVTIPKTQ